jgi:hypothetical protein
MTIPVIMSSVSIIAAAAAVVAVTVVAPGTAVAGIVPKATSERAESLVNV